MTDVIKALQMTDHEVVLAEDYVTVLDYFSRIAGGIQEGNWRYVWDKLADLERAAHRLRERLSDTEIDDDGQEHHSFEPPRINVARVHQAAVAWSQHYWVGRAIHPLTDIADARLRARLTADHARAQALNEALNAGDTDTIRSLINQARQEEDDQ